MRPNVKSWLLTVSPVIVVVLFLSRCSQPEPVKPELEIIWKLERNFEVKEYSMLTASLWLVNRGTQPLSDQDWTIYWNQPPYTIIEVESEKPVSLVRVNGDFYELKPQSGFLLQVGDSLKISYTMDGWMIKESDAPQGVYLAYTLNGEEQTEPIRYYKILPFETAEQMHRSPGDEEPVPTVEHLFNENSTLSILSESEWYPVLPSPKMYVAKKERYVFSSKPTISADSTLEREVSYLQHELNAQFGMEPSTNGKGNIQLFVSNDLTNKEGYRLTVDIKQGVKITGGSPAGVFYGVQSLLSLIRQSETGYFIQVCQIEDEPAFAYRGLHLDVGRNFQSKETVFRILDLLARYKINKFLLYVTEDEGWRLAIKEFPELTEVGGRRGHRYRDSLYLQPAYGSGPSENDATSQGNGFYSRNDFKEIIRYAYDRHIDVIPEINVPGHARAAIRAMELRYHRLMKEGKREEAMKYRLIDPDDKSVYNSAQGYNDNIICVCNEAVYNFFEVALNEILDMYKEAGVPLTMMHAGGDEVPGKAWSESPICKEFLKQHPEIKNSRNLQAYMFDRITNIIQNKGIPIGAWEEAVMAYDDQDVWYPNPQFVGRNVYPYIWNNLWGNQDLGYKLANAGYPVILCNVTNFYFDLAYNKDPREPGLYWAGFVDTKDAFSFVPYNLFHSTTHDAMGKAFNPDIDFAGMQQLTDEGRKNIVGLQAQIWSETLNKGSDQLEYYTVPKLLGFAQRAWQGQPEWGNGLTDSLSNENFLKDWNVFANTVGFRELPALDKFNGGYHYRIPAPGIRLTSDGRVEMNAQFPGFEIRYTTDGSEPDSKSTLYKDPVKINASVIKAACFNRSGRSGFSTNFRAN
jgi:hexosaminidase